jgi:hypothetical protein
LKSGEIFRGEGVWNLLDEELLEQFAHAKRVMEQEKKCVRIKI